VGSVLYYAGDFCYCVLNACPVICVYISRGLYVCGVNCVDMFDRFTKPRMPAPVELPKYMATQLDTLASQYGNVVGEPGVKDAYLKEMNDLVAKSKEMLQTAVEKYNKDYSAPVQLKIADWYKDRNINVENFKAAAEDKRANAAMKEAGQISKFVASVLTSLGPYIALLLFIFLLIAGVALMATVMKSPKNIKSALKKQKAKADKMYKNFKVPDYLNPFSKMKGLMNRFSMSHSPNAFSRPRMRTGRCGNGWIDGGGTCINSQSPPDFDTQIYEGDNPVFIPWLVQDTFFLPQCEETYTIDENGKKTRTEKGKYFTDNGLTCTRKDNDKT